MYYKTHTRNSVPAISKALSYVKILWNCSFKKLKLSLSFGGSFRIQYRLFLLVILLCLLNTSFPSEDKSFAVLSARMRIGLRAKRQLQFFVIQEC